MTTIKFLPSLAKRLRNAEHFDFYDNIVGHLKNVTLKPASLVPLLNAFFQHFEHEDAIYKRYLRQGETQLVQDAREKRKRSFMALKLIVETGLYSDQPQVEEAASLLMKIVDNYADAPRAPMTETSAMIVNMVQDMKLPQHTAAVALVGAAAAIDRLKQDNDDFMNLYYDRASGWEDERDEGSLSQARLLVDQSFARLVEAINVFYQASEMQQPKDSEVSTALSGVIHTINTYIRQYEVIYARRSSRFHTPGDYTPGGDSSSGEEIPPAIPQLAIADQEILGDVPNKPRYGSQMSLRAADAAAFAAILYPAAANGILHLEGEYEKASFPIGGFLMEADGTTVAGLLADAPEKVYFNKPLYDGGPAQATVVKDGQTLAILTGVLYPGTEI
jgi:hypothetical protein